MSETDRTDELTALSQRVQAGDERAFRALFDALHDPLLRFAFSLVRESSVAEDLVQEAFVRLWDLRERVEAAHSLRAYLFRTVRNLAFNHRRNLRTRERLLGDATHGDDAPLVGRTPGPEETLAGREIELRLRECLELLPARQREALLLSRVEGLSHAEVAETMECSPRTVNNHLVAALATLKRHLSHVGSLVASFIGIVS